ADRSLSGSALVHIGLLLRGLYDGFTPLGCGLAVLGAWSMIARARSAGLAIGLAFVFTGPVFVAFANPYIDNPILYGVLERFYILPSVFVAIIIGIGTYEALIKTMAMTPRMLRRAAAATVAVLLLANFAVAFVLNFERADQSGNTVDLNFGEDMLSMFDTGALFIVDGDAATMVTDYLQLVEGRRPDLVPVNIEKLNWAGYWDHRAGRPPGFRFPSNVSFRGGINWLASSRRIGIRDRFTCSASPRSRAFSTGTTLCGRGSPDSCCPKARLPIFMQSPKRSLIC